MRQKMFKQSKDGSGYDETVCNCMIIHHENS